MFLYLKLTSGFPLNLKCKYLDMPTKPNMTQLVLPGSPTFSLGPLHFPTQWPSSILKHAMLIPVMHFVFALL